MCFLAYLTVKKSKITCPAELENLLQKYGTFFKEFKSKSFNSSLFYPLFVIRRLFLIALILFVNDPRVQLTVSFALSLCVPYI